MQPKTKTYSGRTYNSLPPLQYAAASCDGSSYCLERSCCAEYLCSMVYQGARAHTPTSRAILFLGFRHHYLHFFRDPQLVSVAHPALEDFRELFYSPDSDKGSSEGWGYGKAFFSICVCGGNDGRSAERERGPERHGQERSKRVKSENGRCRNMRERERNKGKYLIYTLSSLAEKGHSIRFQPQAQLFVFAQRFLESLQHRSCNGNAACCCQSY